MFTFEGIGIVLPLENKMREPSGIRGCVGVLNTGMVFVACLYIAGKLITKVKGLKHTICVCIYKYLVSMFQLDFLAFWCMGNQLAMLKMQDRLH